jgi:hypothetical protein
LRFYRDFMKAAPDALTAEVSIVTLDQPTILCRVCWSGETTEGDHVLRPLREFGPPVADAIRSVSYTHLTDRPSPEFSVRVFGPPPAVAAPVGVTYDYWKGGSLKELKEHAIEQIAAAIANSSRGMSIGLGHHMHWPDLQGAQRRNTAGAYLRTIHLFLRRKLAQSGTGRSGDGVGGRFVVCYATLFDCRLRELSK